METGVIDVVSQYGSSLFRCVLFDKCLDSNGVLSRDKVAAPFSPLKDALRPTFALSVGMPDIIYSEGQRHDFGCRVAVSANTFFEIRNGRNPVRGTETTHYIGSYRINIGDVLNLKSDIFDVSISHAPEPNLDEHGHIELIVKSEETSKTKMRGETTRIATLVARLLFDPRPHVCEADEDMRDRFVAIQLS